MVDWKEKRRSEYLAKLKDPRWQQVRLLTYQRDGWTCQSCFAKDRSLQAHHSYYEDGLEPWEYPLESLKTLCEDCHSAETAALRVEQRRLIQDLKRFGCDSGDFQLIADSVGGRHRSVFPGLLTLIVSDLLTDEEFWSEVVDLREERAVAASRLRRGEQ